MRTQEWRRKLDTDVLSRMAQDGQTLLESLAVEPVGILRQVTFDGRAFFRRSAQRALSVDLAFIGLGSERTASSQVAIEGSESARRRSLAHLQLPDGDEHRRSLGARGKVSLDLAVDAEGLGGIASLELPSCVVEKLLSAAPRFDPSAASRRGEQACGVDDPRLSGDDVDLEARLFAVRRAKYDAVRARRDERLEGHR